MVPARRLEHRVAEGARHQDLGRVGRRERRTRPRVRCSVAVMADAVWRAHRPDISGHRDTQVHSGFAAHLGFGLERRRSQRDGTDAVSCALPVLCGRR